MSLVSVKTYTYLLPCDTYFSVGILVALLSVRIKLCMTLTL